MNRLQCLCLSAIVLILSPLTARADAPQGALVDIDLAADTETQWMSIVMAGRKIGHARFDHLTADDRITTRQSMTFELGREGVAMAMSIDETHEETRDGEPLAFNSLSRITGLEMQVRGERTADGSFAVKSGAAGQLRDSVLQWPEGALLAWGMEQRMRSLGTVPGTKGELMTFHALMQAAVPIEYEITGPVTLDMPQGKTELIEVRQTMLIGGSKSESRSWLDNDLSMQRMTMDVMGQTLELIACDRDCAQAPNQPADIMTSALVAVPRKLESTDLRHPIVVELHSELPLKDWPGVDGQRLESIDGQRYRVTTGGLAGTGGDAMPAPTERDLLRTDWLNHDAEEVQALLEGLDLDVDPVARMRTLQDVVHRHIGNKNLSIGYASASDAARLREGDCTEHAILLAALGRATGIPTRVVSGLAYADDFGGKPHLVPHAWTTAWNGERWQAFDAALPGHQLRLAMHADDGDPWRFYDGLDTLGQLRVTAIEVLPSGD